MSGCKTCVHQFFVAGEAQCRWSPHAAATPEQERIVAWLAAPARDAWNDEGCPSHKDWRHEAAGECARGEGGVE